jgi:LmbE family N-acetylglucosaminyl deacetylase
VDILYVFAHPDDESFGPQLAMLRQVDAGHAVHILTLTSGGASRLRQDLGVTRRELDQIRARELAAAARVIGCRSVRLGQLEDGTLHRLEPRRVERPVALALEAIDPRLVVTFPHHGINGHGDHCAVHAATLRTFCDWRSGVPGDRRLAFFGVDRAAARKIGAAHPVPDGELGFRIPASEDLLSRAQRALACHRSQARVVGEYRPLEWFEHGLIGTLFRESPDCPLSDLTQGL